MNRDVEHLKLLAIFHYVVGGLHALISCIFFVHIFMGLFMALQPEAFDGGGKGPPPIFGWGFFAVGLFALLMGWTVAGCQIMAGRFMARQRNRTFCIVIAGLECIFFPFGAVLGAFSLAVLLRDSVRMLFDSAMYSVWPHSQT